MKVFFIALLFSLLNGIHSISAWDGDDRKGAPMDPAGSQQTIGDVRQPRKAERAGAAAGWQRGGDQEAFPFLQWHTFLGSNAHDTPIDIDVDANGNIYISGSSLGAWGTAIHPFSGGQDVFVAKIDANGALLWNTFLGSHAKDFAGAITVDRNGYIYIIGYSKETWGSPLLPFSGAGNKAFVARLDNNGNLLWNTFLGGSSQSYGDDIDVDSVGNVYIVGSSESTWGNPLRPYKGQRDAFTAKLAASGNLLWNTFFWGNGKDFGSAIAIDNQNTIHLLGKYERSGPFDNSIFFARLNADGTLLWDNFAGTPFGREQALSGMSIDRKGNYHVLQNFFSYDDVKVAKVCKYSPKGKLLRSANLEGEADFDSTSGYGIALDGSDHVYVTGVTEYGSGYASMNSLHGGYDAFFLLTKSSTQDPGENPIDPTWILYLGGSGNDYGSNIVYKNGCAYIIGGSDARWGNPLSFFNGGMDIFVAKLKPVFPKVPPAPVARIDGPVSVCSPPQIIELKGSATFDSYGSIVAYEWLWQQKPAGSKARFTKSWETASFTADLPGNYIVTLRVKDSFGSWSQSVSHTVMVSSTADDPPGLAIQGARKQVRAWLIRKDLAELTLTVTPITSECAMAVSGYRLLRRENQGAYMQVKELGSTDFTTQGDVSKLTIEDKYLEPGRSYTYRLAALDTQRREAAATEITL